MGFAGQVHTWGTRVGPHMHARMAYHASSRDVTSDYICRDPRRRVERSLMERRDEVRDSGASEKSPDEGRKKE